MLAGNGANITVIARRRQSGGSRSWRCVADAVAAKTGWRKSCLAGMASGVARQLRATRMFSRHLWSASTAETAAGENGDAMASRLAGP